MMSGELCLILFSSTKLTYYLSFSGRSSFFNLNSRMVFLQMAVLILTVLDLHEKADFLDTAVSTLNSRGLDDYEGKFF